MSKVVLVLALIGGFAGPAAFDARAAETSGYNGTWSVELVTESGVCDARYTYSMAISEGRVRLVSGGDPSARLSGKVGSDGTVGLNVSKGSASGAASGRLQAKSGSGTWTVSALCSGRWTARRSTMHTAQAD